MANRDRFGGWTGKTFEATGFFRTEHDGTRWWMVTPEGNVFLTLGINHYHAHLWAQDYNRDHWIAEFGAQQAMDDAWCKGWHARVGSDLQHLGLNSLGIHTNAPRTGDSVTDIAPYVARFAPVDIPHYKHDTGPEKFPDIFSDEFDAHCDQCALEMVKPRAEDPLVLGYSMTDCPIITDLDAAERGMTIYGAPRGEMATWPRVLRNLGADAPGKQAYVGAMRTAYGDSIVAFNQTYGTDSPTWDALLAAVDWRPRTDYDNARERADNMVFVRQCVDTYYRKAKAALRRYDSNHLFFGEKINGNSDTIDNVLDITTKYTDLVFYQIYGRYDEQAAMMDRWTDKVGMPFLNGDSAFSFTCDVMPNPYGPHAEDQAQRAEWLREFSDQAFARPDFVGWHICGTIDTWNTMPRKEDKQHSGLMTAKGEFYPELETAIQDFSARMYEIATRGAQRQRGV
ncbi:MAG: hypothetical protein HN849_10085 [Victivallales bacterium]|jgi:hypothetical protein|nr:hypothetical protein [Victivallales bacterium]